MWSLSQYVSSMYWQLLFLWRVTVNFPAETRDVSSFNLRGILQLGGRRSSAAFSPLFFGLVLPSSLTPLGGGAFLLPIGDLSKILI